MRIDYFKTAPDRSGRYYVRFDNGTEMKLYRQTVEDFGLYAGMDLPDEEYAALQTAASAMSAKMRAIRIISAANVSQRDLESRLIKKGEDASAAREAVDWLQEMTLLDDRKTAESIVQSCISKGYGLARARQVLYEKKIPKEIRETVLEMFPDQDDRIREFLVSKIRDYNDIKQVKRAVDALIRRGHSYSDIRRVLNDLPKCSADFLEEE